MIREFRRKGMKKLTSIILASGVVYGLIGSVIAMPQVNAAKIMSATYSKVRVPYTPVKRALIKSNNKITTIKAAISYIMKSNVGNKYRYAEYRFNTKTTYQGQTAYLINIIAKGTKNVTAKYYVLTNGTIIAVPATKPATKPVSKPVTKPATKIATINDAVKYAINKLNTKYPYAKYHFIDRKMVNGQMGYDIAVTEKGAKAVTNHYIVLADGALLKK